MSDLKRCLYEVLGLNRDCSPEEIRSAYKKLALQHHPDKLISSGVSEEVATARFQEIVNAYEVLSDPRERTWYDSHRSQILFSDPNSKSGSSPSFFDSLNLFSYFSNSAYSGFADTGKGFFKVYGDLFSKIYAQEVQFAREVGFGAGAVRDAPLMGNMDSPYSQVSAFYAYWLDFCSVMDFSWADEYHASAGPNRKSRRIMEEENKKARKKAKREFNESIRGLAEFVKKRDKRVIDMQMKKRLEEEKKRAREKEKKEEEMRAKLERARLHREPEWARVDETDTGDGYDDFDDEEDMKKKNNEFYCVACNKKFKSEKQWINHEKSKKHREKAAELRDVFEQEDFEVEENILGEDMGVNHEGSKDDVDDICEDFEAKSEINDEESQLTGVDDEEEEVSELDEEASILEAMVSGHRSRKNRSEHQPEPSFSNLNIDDNDESSFIDNRKKARNKKKHTGAKSKEDPSTAATDRLPEEVVVNGSEVQEQTDRSNSMSNSRESNEMGDEQLERSQNIKNQSLDRKERKDTNMKSKKSSKGKKQKATSKVSDHSCGTCGEDFNTRNKLFKHLGDTGHAMLKSR
ncbi:DNAJ protein JJJ1 homolog [Aristolochia californica]|uniref:DNAJ protein JJJ1 homolog n=1 Tax=Aristolochia californica TaxID=171875 RepID=UPI0035D81637